MFKLESIKLNCVGGNHRFIPFDKNVSYIYAPNSKGKSLLCDCIDFALGASGNIFSKKGMENIEGIETVIETEYEKLYLLRSINPNGEQSYFFKKENSSEYIQINKDSYNEKITSMLLNGDDREVLAFKEVFDMQISHRAMMFFNFLDQKGMGNLKYIFTKAKSDKYWWYYKDIINYIFNNQNIKKRQTV